MKYKILLAGKNQSAMDDFFYVLSNCFECMTTSVRNSDIATHMKYFNPDAFVYCMSVETKESIISLAHALEDFGRKNQKVILIGENEDCKEFLRLRPDLVSLVLEKPINATTIAEKMLNMLEKQAKQLEEMRAKEQAAEEQAKKDEKYGSDKQILVIDDDPVMLKLIKEKLREKYSVATAISGKIGKAFLDRKETDLILLDYEMPGESGAEILESLRSNEATKDIPVIFLTGINDREKIQTVLKMKPQGYLLKPIEHEKLMNTIVKIIGG